MTEAKPTLDEQIKTFRAEDAAGHLQYSDLYLVRFAYALIARIDTERDARLAAEARVRVLREALRALLDGCIDLDGEEAILPMQMSKARAALKAALPIDTERLLTDEDRAAIANDPFAALKARE